MDFDFRFRQISGKWEAVGCRKAADWETALEKLRENTPGGLAPGRYMRARAVARKTGTSSPWTPRARSSSRPQLLRIALPQNSARLRRLMVGMKVVERSDTYRVRQGPACLAVIVAMMMLIAAALPGPVGAAAPKAPPMTCRRHSRERHDGRSRRRRLVRGLPRLLRLERDPGPTAERDRRRGDASGEVTEIPTEHDRLVTAIAAGSDGALWFTEHGEDGIRRMTTSGQFTSFGSRPPAPNPPRSPRVRTARSGSSGKRVTR